MSGYVFTATCPRCGGELLTDGFIPVVAAPDLGWTDARCDRCLDVIRITVSTSVIEPWPNDRVDRVARRQQASAAAGAYLASSF